MARGPRRAARTILRWPSINCIVQLMRREDLDSPDDYGLLLPLPPPSKGRYVCLHLPELRRRRPRSRMRVLRCCCVCTAPFRACCDAAACALPLSACAVMLLRVHCPLPRVLRCCCVCTAPFRVCCDAAACALPLSCMPCSGLHYLPSAGAACALPALTGGLAQLKFKFSQTRQQQKKKRKKRI
jgi:hypothetical protein